MRPLGGSRSRCRRSLRRRAGFDREERPRQFPDSRVPETPPCPIARPRPLARWLRGALDRGVLLPIMRFIMSNTRGVRVGPIALRAPGGVP